MLWGKWLKKAIRGHIKESGYFVQNVHEERSESDRLEQKREAHAVWSGKRQVGTWPWGSG